MNWKLIITLGLSVIFILFFVSPDSYIYDLYAHVDSSIFFIYGKAWMNGMIPYTDFTEPKGPLLFLIYGIGYLMSHYDCIGVFWISCVFYLGVYINTYRLAGVFKSDSRYQLTITILMSLAWFNPFVHYEIKTEDFAQYFFVLVLYYTCLLLYRDEETKLNSASFCFGVSFGALFLLKFNLAGMIGILGLYILYYAFIKNRFFHSLSYIACGMVVICLPFFLYFSIYGNGVGTFISEYFGTTFALVDATGIQEPLIFRMLSFIMRPAPVIVLVVTLLGIVLYSNKLSRFKYFPVIAFSYFYFIASIYGLSYYYYSTSAMFCIFFFMWLLNHFESNVLNSKSHMMMVNISVIVVVCGINLARSFINQELHTLFFQDTITRKDFYTYAYLMSQVERPTWFTYCYPSGQDMPSGAVPSFRTLGVLPGEKSKIILARNEMLINKEVDFITIAKSNEEMVKELEILGYYRYQTNTNPNVLFSKYQLQMPPKDFHVSNLDILFKRNVMSGVKKMKKVD